MICPPCRGTGLVWDIQQYDSGAVEYGEVTCVICKGTGNVTRVELGRLEDGERLMRDRLSKRLTRREAAEQLGITVVQYADLERGRVTRGELGLDA